jgi:hypothetical protein
MLMWAAEKNVLSANLTAKRWTTRDFKFLAGQLSQIVSNISSRFNFGDEVTGTCIIPPSNISVSKWSNSSLKVLLNANCSLYIRETKVVEWNMRMGLEIEAITYQSYLDFWVRSYTKP